MRQQAKTFVTEVGGATLLLARSLRALPHVHPGEVWRQAHAVANRSVLFIFVTMSFTGAIMVVQGATQAQRLVGDLSSIGPAFLQLATREFGPTIVGLMLAARYGAAVAAHLGSMQITEQVDALRMAGADPITYLVTPRLAGGLVGASAVTVFGTGAAYVAGGVVAHVVFFVGWETYFNLRLVTVSDVTIGGVKTLAYGVVVPLWACYCGLRAGGGPPGVGRATTRAVIGASVALLFFDLLIGMTGYLVTEEGP